MDGDNVSGQNRLIGSAETTVGRIMGSRGSAFTTNIKQNNEDFG